MTDDGSSLAAELREAGIEAMLGEAADDGFAALLTLLRQLHHDTAKRSVTASLDHIFRGDADGLYATFRQARNSTAWRRLATPERLGVKELGELLATLAEAAPLLPKTKAGRTDARWAKGLSNIVGQLHAQDWQALTNQGLIQAALEGGKFAAKDIPADLAEPLTKSGRHAVAELIETLNRQHAATFELLNRFAGHFESRCVAQRVLLFADLTDRLAAHLRTNGTSSWNDDLVFRLDGRVEHLLLDEFQDTSVDQFAVLRTLVKEITGDASDQRTIFVVGDAKQSIYGWRGGRVELFDTLESTLEDRGLEKQKLDQSFRSSPGVLHGVNAVFASLGTSAAWPKHSQAKARFAEEFRVHTAAQPDLPGEFEIRTTRDAASSEANDANGDDLLPQPQAYEASVAEHLRDLVERWPTASLGVLVRTNAQAQALLQACRQAGVPASGETGAALTDHPTINATLAALTLADHPGDQVAAYHVAHSPLAEVLGMTSHHVSEAGRVSRKLRRDLASLGYAGVIGRWIPRLADSCDAAGLRRLRQLAGIAERYQPVSSLRPSAFVRHAEVCRIDDPSSDRVRLMTIHRAKGLEFDGVVLPYLHGDRPFRPMLLEERDGPTGPITAVYRAGRKELRDHIPKLQDLHAEAESRDAYEQLCTLYVALTRAKHATHVLMPPARKGSPRDGHSLMALLLHALLGTDADTGQHDTSLFRYKHADGADAALTARRTAEIKPTTSRKPILRTWPLARRVKPSKSPPEIRPSDGPIRDHESPASESLIEKLFAATDSKQTEAIRLGIRTHAKLESITFLHETEASGRATSRENTEAVGGIVLQEPIREVLLRRGAFEVRREMPIRYLADDQRVVRGTIDRLVWWIDAQGEATHAEVQDFKTDTPGNSTLQADELERWIESRRQHHAEQLEHYRSAAAAWLGLPVGAVKAVLLFTSVGRVVHW
ncbi:MAG: UvrD-helicase domain-containing protein [Planctomycetota bacterium]